MKKDSGDVRRQVAKIAAEYKKAGMSASDAFKKAWSEVERGSEVTKKTGKSIKSEIGGSATYATGKLGGLTAALGKITTLLASAFAVRQIAAFGKECVDLGSNVQEVQNVVDTAFGDMTYKVEAFAATSIQTFGMSQLAAKKTASTYMAMAKGMGIADETASNMAINLAGLTGDVASFYNISQELADTKLKSVFTGETETLKDLGVVMTQANLQAYALEKGITKSIDSMTQAELVGLRYNFVLDQLALASGDFAKTSDSWANQTRVLSMQWQELMSIIGQSLIQVLTPLVRVLNQIVSSLISVAQTASAVISNLFGGEVQAAGAVASEIETSVDNQNALTDATEDTAKAQKKMLAGFDTINKLSGGSDSSSGSQGTVDFGSAEIQVPVVNMDTAANEKVLGFVQSIKDAFTDFTSQVDWEQFKSSADGLRDSLSRLGGIAFDALRQFWEDVLQPLGIWVLNTAAPVFLNGLNEGLDLLADIAEVLLGKKSVEDLVGELTPLQTALLGLAAALTTLSLATAVSNGLSSITTFIQNVSSLGATSIIGKLAEVFMLTASGAGTLSEAMRLVFGPGSIIAGVAGIVGGAITAVTNFITMLQDGFSWVNEALMLVGTAIAAIGAVVLGAPARVAGIVAGIVAAVATAVVLVKEHWESIKAFFIELWDGIKIKASEAWTFVKSVWTSVATWFDSTIVQPIASFFGNLWGGIKSGASQLVTFIRTKVVNPIVAAFSGLYNSVVGIIEGVVNGFIGIINGFIGGINGVIDIINDIPGVELPMISKLPAVEIPRLAEGAVIPANREFLAVLGDQKTGTNIEAPLSTIEQAVENVLRRSGYGTGSGSQTVILELDRQQFGKVVYRLNKEESRRIGVSLGEVHG